MEGGGGQPETVETGELHIGMWIVDLVRELASLTACKRGGD